MAMAILNLPRAVTAARICTGFVLTLLVLFFSTSSPASGSPAIASPAAGSTIGSPTLAFTWSANGTNVDEWWVYAGSTQGGRQYYDSLNLFGSTTEVIGNLPDDGSPVYVRLWYR